MGTEADERWVDILGWPYQVYDLGRVRRVHICEPIKTQKTYCRISLSRGRNNHSRRGFEKAFFVHRLVAEAFLGPCPEGKSHVAHKDGNAQNNTVENLYWATPKENAADKARHGRVPQGETHHAATVSDEDARLIRAHYHIGNESVGAIARLFFTTPSVVSRLVKGKTYRHAGGYL